jgi:hypothetical protein
MARPKKSAARAHAKCADGSQAFRPSHPEPSSGSEYISEDSVSDDESSEEDLNSDDIRKSMAIFLGVFNHQSEICTNKVCLTIYDVIFI